MQQEPLLFNESIKQNILYGDGRASDKRIREVAVQANALGFILQSHDDLNSPLVVKRIKSEFMQIASAMKFLNYATLGAVARDCSEIPPRVLQLLNTVFPYLNSEGLSNIDAHFHDEFLAICI